MASPNGDDFVGDPYLVGVDPKALLDGCSDRDGGVEGEARPQPFGLPLVAAWRSFPSSVESGYDELTNKVASCFDATTGQGADGKSDDSTVEPEAHIYPFEDLHVTVVTFRNSLDPAPASNERAEAVKRFCANVVDNSSMRDAWPKGKAVLRLRPKEIHLGKKNAFILWEESSGVIEAMRPCLREEMDAQLSSQLGDDDVDPASELSSFFVPNIVHSTFMRFWTCPSDPKRLKQVFEDSSLLDLLPTEVVVDANVSLVYEDRPCMHINADDSHILWKAE